MHETALTAFSIDHVKLLDSDYALYQAREEKQKSVMDGWSNRKIEDTV